MQPVNLEHLIGCSHGMNCNVLHGNICSTKPVNLSVQTNGGQILLGLSLPTFSSWEQSAVHFLKDFDEHFKLKSVDERLKLTLVSNSLTEEFARNWFMATKEHINTSLKYNFFISFVARNHNHTHGHRFIDVGIISPQTAAWLHILRSMQC